MMGLIIVAVWLIFLGAVWAGWVSIAAHSLGILTLIVGLVVLFLEVAWPYWRRHNANP